MPQDAIFRVNDSLMSIFSEEEEELVRQAIKDWSTPSRNGENRLRVLQLIRDTPKHVADVIRLYTESVPSASTIPFQELVGPMPNKADVEANRRRGVY